jgi:hypothetical protein
VGDVDGDGKNELVFITQKHVYIYKWGENRYRPFRNYKSRGWSPDFLYVSVADIDRNGKAEIYVSNITGSGIASLILEWDGSSFKPIAEDLRWYIRAIKVPGGKQKVLIGQKRPVNGSFLGHVQYLKRDGNNLVADRPLHLPRGGNVFNFLHANLDTPTKTFTVMLNFYERLVLFDHHDEEIWKSDDFFGGSLHYIEDKAGGHEGDARVDVGRYVYIPSPILLTDADDDGKKEVLVCRNLSRSGRLFERARNFGSGKLHFMIWDKAGLTTKWTSRQMSGPIVGYTVADGDNDGKPELLMASVVKEAFMTRNARTQLVQYDLR